MLEKQEEASVTVEASFIIPIVIFVVIGLIYFTFYLHDKVRLEEVLEKALGQGNFIVTNRSQINGVSFSYDVINEDGNWGYFINSYEDKESKLLAYLNEELEKKFFFLKKQSVSCEINSFSVHIEISMKGKISINPLHRLWKQKNQIMLEQKRTFHNPEEILRVYEGLKFIMDNISEFTFAEKHIEKIKMVVEDNGN